MIFLSLERNNVANIIEKLISFSSDCMPSLFVSYCPATCNSFHLLAKRSLLKTTFRYKSFVLCKRTSTSKQPYTPCVYISVSKVVRFQIKWNIWEILTVWWTNTNDLRNNSDEVSLLTTIKSNFLLRTQYKIVLYVQSTYKSYNFQNCKFFSEIVSCVLLHV